MSKFVIFDGNALLHRAYHALPPLTTQKGEPINAVYGMISMMIKVLDEFKPEYLAFAFDTKEPTFRNKLSAEYQAQRLEVEPNLIGQFEKARITLEAFHIPYFERAGFEADDLIGTIVTKLATSEEVDKTIVVTGDRDLLQLIDKKTRLFMPTVGMSNGKLFGPEETKEKMGVYPEQIVDYKALVGDPSDNYKGVPGIGPKTAITLLTKYQTLDKVMEHLAELPHATAEKITKNKDSALLSKTLATIVRDIDVPSFSLEACKSWQLDSPEGIELFHIYGFKTLTKRMEDAAQKHLAEKQLSLLS